MKLLHLTYHFEFSDQIEKILAAHDIRNYVRYARVAGKGKRRGFLSQSPGRRQ
jgi:hypothetical protein